MRRIVIIIGMIVLVAGGLWFYERQIQSPRPQAVVLDQSGNLQLIGLDGRSQLLRAAPERGRLLQVTPAPAAGGVAYIVDQASHATIEYLRFDGAAPIVLHDDEELRPFYVAWSPDGRWLAFLATRVFMELYVVPADGSAEPQLVRAGQPSYFAWTPDSSRMLLHIGGAAPRGMLFEYLPESHELIQLDQAPGVFQAPAWTSNESALIVTQESAQNQLMLRENSVLKPLIEPTTQYIVFTLAPDRQSLAYMTLNDTLRSPIHILDLATKSTNVLPVSFPIAFFWSPDGQKIAALIPERYPGQQAAEGIVRVSNHSNVKVRWLVADVASGEITAYEPWTPHPTFINLLPYFDQYASSLSFWSPDSQNLIYTDVQGVQSLAIRSGQITQLSQGSQGYWIPTR